MAKYVNIKISINIDGKSQIHNAKMEEGMHFQNNGDTYLIKDGSIWNSSNQKVDSIKMTKYQYNIFEALANNVKESGQEGVTLSSADISDEENGALKKWSLGQFGSDMSEFINKTIYSIKGTHHHKNSQGQANGVEMDVMQAENNVATLKFWFDNQNTVEKNEGLSKTKTDKKKINNTSQTKQKTTIKSAKSNNNVASVIENFTGGNIPISDVKDMATVAKYTGISEAYIRDILVGIEGKKNYPLCKAEYDGVPGKNHPNGYLTIGFGHTALTGNPTPNEGMSITVEQAYQILANDIIMARKYAINTIKNLTGEDLFNKVPKSIQNALIDLSFNKGPGELKNPSLIANLEKGYYGAASRRTWYATNNVGLQKRNVYRFLESIKDIEKEKQRAAIRIFYQDHIQQLRNVFIKDNNAKIAWNDACAQYGAKEYIC